ncbi:maleylpyruvate isomerase family mycothiol-dependent enzyme [Actinosynnema sp. NPDC051121]
MEYTLAFPDLLRLIDERSAAFRAAVAAAPDLDARVPTCPDWTLLELAQHMGDSRRRWAAIVAAGPDAAPPPKSAPEGAPTAPRDRDALEKWSAAATDELLDALREVGPDRACWTWWSGSQSPRTTGAVARHQLHEIAVHTYDAQLTAGAARPLPDEVALDGADEFLHTCCATTSPWPHEPAVLDYRVAEGRSWRLHLSADGARATRRPDDDGVADLTGRATASDLVLSMFGRIPVDDLDLEGDRRVLHRLVAWEPEV